MTLEDRLHRAPVVILTGARQTGKTTLVRNFAGAKARRFVSLDSLGLLDQARRAPEALVAGPEPLTIDEIQRAPELLLEVKKSVDESRRNGRFLLTGSANLLLMQRVSESLAGRSSYLTLRPLTEREKRGAKEPPVWDALLSATSATEALDSLGRGADINWAAAALAGGFPPAALSRSETDRVLWFEGYVETYLLRDVRDFAQVGDLAAFGRFLRLAALRVGGLLNQAEIGRDTGISQSTAQRWFSILEASYAVTLLPAFSAMRAKRLIKASKLYFGDTGLGLHLTGISEPGELKQARGSGNWLENLILNDLLAFRETEIRKPELSYMRTAGGEEVDLILERGKRLLPMEVKSAGEVRVDDALHLERFREEHPSRVPYCLVIFNGKEPYLLTQHTVAVPVRYLL